MQLENNERYNMVRYCLDFYSTAYDSLGGLSLKSSAICLLESIGCQESFYKSSSYNTWRLEIQKREEYRE